MIAKPPQTKDVALNSFLQTVATEFNQYMHVLEVPASRAAIASDDVVGNFPIKNLTAATSAYFSFIVPYSLRSIREVTIRFIPIVTGSFDYTVTTEFGGVDESYNASTSTTGAVTGTAVTNNKISEIDITNLFVSVDRNDHVGVKLTVNSLTTTTNIKVLSLYLKYF